MKLLLRVELVRSQGSLSAGSVNPLFAVAMACTSVHPAESWNQPAVVAVKTNDAAAAVALYFASSLGAVGCQSAVAENASPFIVAFTSLMTTSRPKLTIPILPRKLAEYVRQRKP